MARRIGQHHDEPQWPHAVRVRARRVASDRNERAVVGDPLWTEQPGEPAREVIAGGRERGPSRVARVRINSSPHRAAAPAIGVENRGWPAPSAAGVARLPPRFNPPTGCGARVHVPVGDDL